MHRHGFQDSIKQKWISEEKKRQVDFMGFMAALQNISWFVQKLQKNFATDLIFSNSQFTEKRDEVFEQKKRFSNF